PGWGEWPVSLPVTRRVGFASSPPRSSRSSQCYWATGRCQPVEIVGPGERSRATITTAPRRRGRSTCWCASLGPPTSSRPHAVRGRLSLPCLLLKVALHCYLQPWAVIDSAAQAKSCARASAPDAERSPAHAGELTAAPVPASSTGGGT